MPKYKFTPGPWAVDESRHDGSINRLEPFRHIGMVIQFLHNHTSRAENEANAKLIAAAPDLIEALQDLVVELGDDWNLLHNFIDRARDAIAKATE